MRYVTPISKELCSKVPLLEPDLGMRLVTSKHFCSRSLAQIKKVLLWQLPFDIFTLKLIFLKIR